MSLGRPWPIVSRRPQRRRRVRTMLPPAAPRSEFQQTSQHRYATHVFLSTRKRTSLSAALQAAYQRFSANGEFAVSLPGGHSCDLWCTPASGMPLSASPASSSGGSSSSRLSMKTCVRTSDTTKLARWLWHGWQDADQALQQHNYLQRASHVTTSFLVNHAMPASPPTRARRAAAPSPQEHHTRQPCCVLG